MSENATAIEKVCLGCRFAAPVGDQWDSVTDVTFGTLTRCPECGSTNIQNAR